MRSALVDAFCETVVPAVEGEPSALLGVSAADLGVPERIGPEAENLLAGALGADFTSLGPEERTDRLNERVAAGDAAAYELRRLRALVVALSYGLTTDGRNPLWAAIGYPGPITRPPTPEERPKRIAVLDP